MTFDRPQVQALVVADHVYKDQGTDKHIVTGIFHTLFVISVPQGATPSIGEPSKAAGEQQPVVRVDHGFLAGSPFAYLSMVNVRGHQEFTLRYVELETDNVTFEAQLKIDCSDPIEPVELRLPLPMLPRKIGTYALELIWKDEPLGSYRINVRQQPLPTQEGQE